VAGYSGDAGDAMAASGWSWWDSNGKPFSTLDDDNDSCACSCANNHNSGWWFSECSVSLINEDSDSNWTTEEIYDDVQTSRMMVKIN